MASVQYKGVEEPVTCRGSAFDQTKLQQVNVEILYKENSFCGLDVIGNEPSDLNDNPDNKPETPNGSFSLFVTIFIATLMMLF